MTDTFILALDQGTTSSRAIVFGKDGEPVSAAQEEFPQHFPKPGHVEHDPEDIWCSQLKVASKALQKAHIDPSQIAAIGVTNQRETVVLWERETGKPVGNAIVWQSRITSALCDQLKRDGQEEMIREKTGLIIDPYFSGTKIKYLLDQNSELRQRAEKGEVLFGTVDSFLMWRLSGGKLHITDVTNASRTLLFNIHTLQWDEELLKALEIPRAMLPEVRPSSLVYGETSEEHFGTKIPLAGMAGDQQAATFGQGCFQPGDVKNTYGTGCFMLMNTGEKPAVSHHGLLTTVGWQLGENQPVTYCLEGAVFIAGATMQWLRDGLCLVKSAAESEALAESVPDTEGVYFVPAFVGLGAPYWDSQARGTIVGITRGTTRAHIVRAGLESMAFQSRDVLDAMQKDADLEIRLLKVDGGATANNFLMQFQADILDKTVQRPVVQETTALGAAYLAGLAVGFWKDLDDIKLNWMLDKEFTPQMEEATRNLRYHRWQQAVERSRRWDEIEETKSGN